jgi:hypothetical protein
MRSSTEVQRMLYKIRFKAALTYNTQIQSPIQRSGSKLQGMNNKYLRCMKDGTIRNGTIKGEIVVEHFLIDLEIKLLK